MAQEPDKVQSENPAGEETQAESATEDYAGYGSLEEMRSAIYASRKEGKRLAEHNQMLAAQIDKVTRLLPSEKAANRRALDEINDLGLPADTFRQAVKDEIREELTREMAPITKTNEAVSRIRANHPTFSKSEADFNKWLVANPDVAEQYNNAVMASPDAAELLLKGVFMDYETSRHAVPNSEPKKIPSGAKLPSIQSSGGARQNTKPQLSREDLKDLLTEARNSGDPVKLMRAMIGDRPIHRDFERSKD